MCVAALGGLAGVVSLASTAVSVVGTVVGMSAQSAAAQAQEQQDRNNAIIAKRNAEDARQRGIVAEQDVQLRTRAQIGKQINVLSERNIDVGSGSPLDIIGDTAMFGKLDALTTRQNFEREAIAYEAQQMNFNASADVRAMEGRAARIGGTVAALGTALGGVGDYMKVTNPRGSMGL